MSRLPLSFDSTRVLEIRSSQAGMHEEADELIFCPLLVRFTLPRRYALQLISPASILARLAGRTEIGIEDISEMNELFLDAKR